MESVFVPVLEFVDKNYCRACTNYNDANDMISLFHSDKNVVGEIFSQCTLLKLSESDGLPMYICNICHDQLLSFNTFRLACLEADSFFRNKIKIKNEHTEDVHIPTVQEPDGSSPINESLTIKISAQRTDRKEYKKIESPRKLHNVYKESQLESNSLQSNVKEETLETPEVQENVIQASDMITDGYVDPKPEGVTVKKKTRGTITNRHQKSRESSNIFRCDMCMKKFFHKRNIEAHMRTHQGLKAHKCNDCDKSYINRRSLKIHRRLHHNDGIQIQYKCVEEGCHRNYARKQSLAAHFKAFHLKIKKIISNERHFTCEICGSSFRNNPLLQNHIFIHTGMSKFKCELCQKKFSTKSTLKVHMNRHNGIKNYICMLCGLRTVTGRELRVHMNYHTKEKQHKCKFCEKIFLNSGNMLRHIRIVHCGEKSYKCTYCERSFGKPETLKHHVMTHTGEKPHACEICGKRFIQWIALKTHMKTHRNK